MIWKRIVISAALLVIPFALIVLVTTFFGSGETVIGAVIQFNEAKITVTGEKLTVLVLMDEATGGNCYLAVNGHNSGIKLGDRIQAVYSKRNLAAHSTDSLGNRWNYWRVKSFKKL